MIDVSFNASPSSPGIPFDGFILLICGIFFIFLLVLAPSMVVSSLFLFVVVVDVIMMCCCSTLDSSLAVYGFQFCKMVEGTKGSK